MSPCPRFEGHSKDVLSVAFSADNRQIISGSRDKTVKLWNTLADCKYTIQDDGHSDWVSCVRFSPSTTNPLIVSAGWDKMVKVRAGGGGGWRLVIGEWRTCGDWSRLTGRCGGRAGLEFLVIK